MSDYSSVVSLLLILVVAAMIVAIILFRKARRTKLKPVDDSLTQDREHLQRLEAIDQRLESLEKTLQDIPS